MDIKFHCEVNNSFDDAHRHVRAFLYSDYSIPLHNHDFYEMNIIFKGKGTHMIENNRYPVEAGDVFVIPPMIAHAYYDTDGLDVYHVLFTREFMNEIADEASTVPGFLSFVEIEPYLRQHCSDTVFLHLNPSKLLEIKAELMTVEDGGAYDAEKLVPIKKHGVAKLLYELSYCLHSQLEANSAPVRGKYDTAVISALEYMHLNYQSKITLSDLTRHTFLSRSTLLRCFRELCGCSPSEYLVNYRKGKALELLASGAYSKTEIAYKCGFYDLSHMERMIKEG